MNSELFRLFVILYELCRHSFLLPDVLRYQGVVINFLGTVFDVVHEELSGEVVQYVLELDVVGLVGLHLRFDDDFSEAS